MDKWVSVGKYGLRYRVHPDKTTGVGKRKRPVRYYTAVYKWRGKVATDAYGWEGEDFHNEDDIVETALMLRQNRKAMTPPFTLRELIEERKQALDAKEKEEQRQANRWTIGRLWDEYQKQLPGGDAGSTDKGRWRIHLQEQFSHKEPHELVKLDTDRVRIRLMKNRSPQTAKHVLALLRRIINFGVDRGLIAPLHFKINMPTTDNKRQRYLSPAEANAVLEEIRPHSEQTHNICLLSLNTGMRFGEIASLLWQHINTETRSILIVDPKNGESRSAYMTESIVLMFSSIERGKPNELVFPARTGEKMVAASKAFFRAVDRLGLNDGITDRRLKVVFHSLRHSCASWLVNAGVEIPTIAKILGHKTLQMTIRYSHVNDVSVRNAMRTLDQQQEQTGKVVKISITDK